LKLYNICCIFYLIILFWDTRAAKKVIKKYTKKRKRNIHCNCIMKIFRKKLCNASVFFSILIRLKFCSASCMIESIRKLVSSMKLAVLEMKILIYGSESNSWTKFYWSWARWLACTLLFIYCITDNHLLYTHLSFELLWYVYET
jgi:hypothetical protein